MVEIELDKPFFSLPAVDLEHRIDGFVLDTDFYEEAIAERNGGLKLDSIKRFSIPEDDLDHFEEIVPYHRGSHYLGLLSDAVSYSKLFSEPFAKIIKDKSELEKDILKVYQVAYSHYVVAKHYGFAKTTSIFPYNCCGLSSRGTTGTLWMHRLLNACSAVYSEIDFVHAYVILPFIMLEPKFNGVIIMDPTSDQLGKNVGEVRRNMVAVREGSTWEYRAGNDSGVNLFPNRIFHIGTLLTDEAILPDGRLNDDEENYFHDGKSFLDAAYSNPIDLSSLQAVDNLRSKYFFDGSDMIQ